MLSLLADSSFCQDAAGVSKDSYIAKVGTSFISEREFRDRFELTPAFGKRSRSQLDMEKLEFAYSLVAEKLLAHEAMEQGIDKDSLVQAALANVRRLLARDELFRREVSQSVQISPREIADGMKKAQRELVLRYLFFENRQDADFVRKQMKTRQDFDRLTIDTSMAFLRDTVTLAWGDADVSIESAAYSLRKGDVSRVVPAGDGFYILTLESEKSSRYYGSMQPPVFRERVEEKLRSRMEKARMEEYVRALMAKKDAYGRSGPVKELSDALWGIARESGSDSVLTVSPEMAAELRRRTWTAAMDSVVVIQNEVWSLDVVLDKFVASGFNITARSREELFDRLNEQLKVWTQQELLAQEALKRGLDEDPAVRNRMEMWREHVFAEALKNRVRAEMAVTPGEVWSYMAEQDASLQVPQVQLRVLRTASLSAMGKALDELTSGKSFASVVRQWTADTVAKESGGLTDFTPITKGPFGPIAWEMKVGERRGPLTLPEGIYLIELERKKIPPKAADTAFVSSYKKATNEYLKIKKNEHLDVYLAHLGSKLGFAVYEDRIRQMNLSSIPMVTYRILGFGGRMFEVPFVDKQTDWLGVDATKGQTIQ